MNRQMNTGFGRLRSTDMSQTQSGGSIRKRLGNAAASGFFAFLTLYSVVSTAQIADIPLAVSKGANPNIVFVLDDSGSMGREYMPNSISGDRGQEYYYSVMVNKQWFDPTVDYKPPMKSDDSGRMDNSSYTSAWTDGYTKSGDVDLSSKLPHRGNDVTSWSTSPATASTGAFYYEFDDNNANCDGSMKDNDCYTLVEVNEVNNAKADVKENFANWFSYYRSRKFAARAGISEAFLELNSSVRLGWGAINENNTTVGGENTDTLVQGVRPYNSDGRKAFRNWLYKSNASGGTPLRTSLQDVGEYYERTDDSGPWSDDPEGGVSDGTHSACRQSFSILMTDGEWNGGSPSVNEVDNAAGSSISSPSGDTFQYSSVEPFADSQSNTLADVAMTYWNRDLRTDLDNVVPHDEEIDPSKDKINPAFWQHMVTYGVGLGVTGTVNPEDAIAAIATNDSISWGDTDTSSGKIDDLLHAGVNSRGGFFSANSPEVFAKELGSVLEAIQARVESSATAAAASSAILNAASDRFRAGFRSTDWSGRLVSENIETGAENWNAEVQLRNNTSRQLFTSDSGSGVALAMANLSATKTAALNTAPDGTVDSFGSDRIAWLSGDDSANAAFRERSSPEGLRLLGDIVNSDPQIERKKNFGHSRLPDGNYNSYRNSAAYEDRPDVLYVGANDGYLHAFNANDGEELFAYMPSSLLEPEGTNSHAPINELMAEGYEHRYFVDGTPTIADAYINNEWKTILLGSMGAGGEQVFALDISEPTTFSESDILWEFSAVDLKRGVDAPQVGRLATGDWAAVFGNGSAAGSGKLFVVNLETGNLIKTLDGGTGGLASPVFTMDNGIIEYAYAGSMDGELFRFDLSNSNTNQWDSTKLFQAQNAAGDAQPITSRPRVANMPKSLDKRVVTFGTGSFFRTGDRGDSTVQSLYGIIDDEGASTGIQRTDLVEQTILGDTTETIDVEQDDGSTTPTDFTVRRTSDNPLGDTDQGWFLDLNEVSGERVVSDPTFPSGLDRSRVRFTTLIPKSDPCSSGTTGFIMELGLAAGGNPTDPVFDLSKDKDFNDDDYCTEDCGGTPPPPDLPPSGTKLLGGEELSTIRDDGRDCIVTSGDLCLRAGDIGVGRQSWKQIR